MIDSAQGILIVTHGDGREERLTPNHPTKWQLRQLAALRRRQRFLASRLTGAAPGKAGYDQAEEQALRWACEILESVLGVKPEP